MKTFLASDPESWGDSAIKRRPSLLATAEAARQLTMDMNALGSPLDWGVTPSDVREAGAYWLAQELTKKILTEYLKHEGRAEAIYEEVIETGESITYILKLAGLHHDQPPYGYPVIPQLLERVIVNEADARQWMRDLFAAGFTIDPDTSGVNVVTMNQQISFPVFTAHEARRYDSLWLTVIGVCSVAGLDVYAVANEVSDELHEAQAAQQAEQGPTSPTA